LGAGAVKDKGKVYEGLVEGEGARNEPFNYGAEPSKPEKGNNNSNNTLFTLSRV